MLNFINSFILSRYTNTSFNVLCIIMSVLESLKKIKENINQINKKVELLQCQKLLLWIKSNH